MGAAVRLEGNGSPRRIHVCAIIHPILEHERRRTT